MTSPLDNRYTVRLAVLEVLSNNRRPLELVDVAAGLEVFGITLPEVRDQVPGLIDHNYIENLRPGRGMLLRITAKGRDQVTRDAPLEEYIHGADAFIG